MALGDVRSALWDLLQRPGYDIALATREIASSCAAMLSLTKAPGALLLPGIHGEDPVNLASAIASHFGFAVAPRNLAAIAASVTDLDAGPMQEPAWIDGLSDHEQAIVSGALQPYVSYFAGGELEPIVWEADLFFANEERLPAIGPIDITGLGRILVFGPYINLPPGPWSATIVVGFSAEETRRFRRYIREPYGMVLVTGPTGSGKTTTLYAAINEIKTDEDKIVTIEDPVEYQLRGITQIPVNEKKGLTFARGLRSILRHDPDKIMVGEIRDQETAQIAIQSALTGHLVFTTVHANNVTDVIGRFINMGVEPYNFVSALNCIMAQRLVRVICPSCKKPKRYSSEELKEAGLDPAIWVNVVLVEGAGCLECSGTGYHGRTAICELLDLTDRIREMIVDRRPTSEIKRVAREEGMTPLRESGLAKIRAGITTVKEINKVTFVE